SLYHFLFVLLPSGRPPTSTLFPYTTLFRSQVEHAREADDQQQFHVPAGGQARHVFQSDSPPTVYLSAGGRLPAGRSAHNSLQHRGFCRRYFTALDVVYQWGHKTSSGPTTRLPLEDRTVLNVPCVEYQDVHEAPGGYAGSARRSCRQWYSP